MELFAAIRFDGQRNQMGVRALACKYNVHRRTVRQALESPVPPGRKTPSRRAAVLDGVRGLIDGMLREDLAAPRKQRHTARRVFERLHDEYGAQVSYSYVCKYVACRRVADERRPVDGPLTVIDGPPGVHVGVVHGSNDPGWKMRSARANQLRGSVAAD